MTLEEERSKDMARILASEVDFPGAIPNLIYLYLEKEETK